MSESKLETALICDFENETKEELIDYLRAIETALSLSSGAYEVLRQLNTQGPVWDGDLISKSGRTQCLHIGAAAKIICNGDDGYQACTYYGRQLIRIREALEKP